MLLEERMASAFVGVSVGWIIDTCWSDSDFVAFTHFLL